jgi:mannose-1-phosphate guanylyltransferase
MNYVAIMAGGVGSRFWPSSRENLPKQFLDIMGTGKSLLQMTFERAANLVPNDHIFILTHAKYLDLVLEQLPDMDASRVLLEPSRNNTAPCIAYLGLKLRSLDPEANFAVLPSDHLIMKEDVFEERMRRAFAFTAANEAIVTLGIQPVRPDTGYGYIKFDNEIAPEIHPVERFVEKPNLATAKEYVTDGGYLWNAGIFVWKATTLLAGLETNAAEVLEVLNPGLPFFNTDREQAFINTAYPRTPNISIDYALLEHAKNVFTIPADMGWSDLGTWASLYAESVADENGNVVVGAEQQLYDVQDCLIRTKTGKLVVIKDLHNYIIVDTDDVLLIHPKHKEQEIKAVTADVKSGWNETFL